jgi:5,10-methylenetetrahydromethanopterin reductase
LKRIGLCFTGQPYSITQMVSAAQRAEELGYDSVWVAEDSWTGRDAITVLTALALNTRRVRLGTCLVGAGTRHPILTAMTFNSLRELAPGRLVLGTGLALGWQPAHDGGDGWGGRSALGTMRDTVEAMRSLFTGGQARWGDGTRGMMVPRPWFGGARLPRPEAIPLYMGAVGPKMTSLAGEVADGLLLEMEALRDFIPERLKLFRDAAAKAGRDASRLEVLKLVLTSVTGDGPLNQNAVGWGAKSVSLLDEATVGRLGWDQERVARVRLAWSRGDWDAGKAAMTPSMVRAFVSAGTQEHALGVIEETVATGVDLPVLIPYGGELRQVLDAGAAYVRAG